MNNNKQSSIDWLVKELNQKIDYIPMSQWDEIREIISEAKAMHKEEVQTAFRIGDKFAADYFGGNLDEDEQYYNETYGGNND